MEDPDALFIEIGQLQKGLFIQLDLGWMDHPFPVSSFKVSSDEQIQTLRALGLQRLRYLPAKSDPDALPRAATPTAQVPHLAAPDAMSGLREKLARDAAGRQQRRSILREQADRLQRCEQRFAEVSRQFRRVIEQARSQPQQARLHGEALVGGCVRELLDNGESAIRLLSETAGDRLTLHPVNVTVIALLLGRALGMDGPALAALGLAAVMHDIGKIDLPERVRLFDDQFSAAENRLYQEHVARGVAIGRSMGLPPDVLRGIAQHHEMVDGSGFPAHAQGEEFGRIGRLLALVNRYDNLCNPARLATALTPHEALSLMFAQMKSRFDPVALSAFIRMMGVYPPGSVVQLVNDRYAMVVSVNSSRPLRPCVIVHDAGVPKDDAVILDLETAPGIGIRRSLRPNQLPKAALDYLSPRQRICYFFERAVGPQPPAADEAGA